MLSGWLFTHLGWHIRGNFSGALIKSATGHVCVKCSCSCVFIVRGTDRYRQKGGRVRGGTPFDGLNLLLCRRLCAHTQTHMHVITSHNGAKIQSVSVQEMGFIYLTPWRLDAPAIAQTALFCQLRIAKLILIIWYNCCRQMSHQRGNK